MSNGIAEYADEKEMKAAEARRRRIAVLGPSEMIKAIDRIADQFQRLEELLTTLPRGGWQRVDEIKKELNKLG